MTAKPLLLFIEGPKGTGKSTLVENLCKLLVAGVTDESISVERFRHARPAPEVFGDPIARNMAFSSQRAVFCAGLRGRQGPTIVVCDRWNHSAYAAIEYLHSVRDRRGKLIDNVIDAERQSTGDLFEGDLCGRRLTIILNRSNESLRDVASARECPLTDEDKYAVDWYRRYEPNPIDHGPMHTLNVDRYTPAALAARAAQCALEHLRANHFLNAGPR